MARGNWQRRVETAENRRIEQRDRKSRQKEDISNKSEYQKYVRHLFSLIDEQYGSCSSTDNTVAVHLWLDRMPSSSSSKAAAGSNCNTINDQKQPHVNNNNNNKVYNNSKKSIHPRSNAKLDDSNANNNFYNNKCCRQYFFYGQCCAKSNNTNNTFSPHAIALNQRQLPCIHHLQHVTPSLVECTSLRKGNNTTDTSSTSVLLTELKYSLEAATLRTIASSSNTKDHLKLSSVIDPAMNILFHLPLDIVLQQQGADNAMYQEQPDICGAERGEEQNILCQPSLYIQKSLVKEQISITNIVYVVIDGRFWFDRNRGGVVLPSPSPSLNDNNNNNPNTTVRSQNEQKLKKDNSNDICKETIDQRTMIPSNLLVFIFMFLPDQYVTILSMVCKDYAKEIASNKNLWSFLLQRRGWPTTTPATLATSENNLEDKEHNNNNFCRSSYISHVMASGLLRTFAHNVTSLVSGGGEGGTINSYNRTYNNFINLPMANNNYIMNFKATKGAPSIDDKCVALKILDNTNDNDDNMNIKTIGAFSREGTIRAFELTQSSKNEASSLIRQVVSVRATPLMRDSTLVAMDMDDKFIACLCYVPNDSGIYSNERSHTAVLNVLRTEDFWCCGTNGKEMKPPTHSDIFHGSSKTSSLLDLSTAILESIHRQHHCLDDDLMTPIPDVEAQFSKHQRHYPPRVSVSPSIVACGGGNFILHVELLAHDRNNNSLEAKQDSTEPKQYLAIYSASAEDFIVMHDITSSIITDAAGMTNSVANSTVNSPTESSWKVIASFNTRTCKTIKQRSSGRSGILCAFQQQPPFRFFLAHVQIEFGKANFDDLSLLDCCQKLNVPVMSRQGILWQHNSLVAEIMASSKILAIAKNSAGFIEGETHFKSVVSFYNLPSALAVEGVSCSSISESHELNDCIVDAIYSAGKQHIIILGRMYLGERGHFLDEYNTMNISSPQIRANTVYGSRNGQWNYFASIIDAPTGYEIFRVQLDDLHCDQSLLHNFEPPSPCPVIAATNGQPCIVAIPLGRGIIMVQTGGMLYVAKDSAVGCLTRSKMKKRNKIATSFSGKKDGFARGMSLRG